MQGKIGCEALDERCSPCGRGVSGGEMTMDLDSVTEAIPFSTHFFSRILISIKYQWTIPRNEQLWIPRKKCEYANEKNWMWKSMGGDSQRTNQLIRIEIVLKFSNFNALGFGTCITAKEAIIFCFPLSKVHFLLNDCQTWPNRLK